MVEVLKFDTIMIFSLSSIQVDFLGNCFATPEKGKIDEELVKFLLKKSSTSLTHMWQILSVSAHLEHAL